MIAQPGASRAAKTAGSTDHFKVAILADSQRGTGDRRQYRHDRRSRFNQKTPCKARKHRGACPWRGFASRANAPRAKEPRTKHPALPKTRPFRPAEAVGAVVKSHMQRVKHRVVCGFRGLLESKLARECGPFPGRRASLRTAAKVV